MSIIEDSFTLLSSMSPKVDTAKKSTMKKATKLTLKKPLNYDRKSSPRNNNIIYTINSSSEETSSSDEAVRRRNKNVTHENIIVIESSSESDSAGLDQSDKDSYQTAASVISESEVEEDETDLGKNSTIDWKSKKTKDNILSQKCIDIVQKYLQDDISKPKDGFTSPFVQKWIEDLDINLKNDDYPASNTFGEVSKRILRFSEIAASVENANAENENSLVTAASVIPESEVEEDGVNLDNNTKTFVKSKKTNDDISRQKCIDDLGKYLQKDVSKPKDGFTTPFVQKWNKDLGINLESDDYTAGNRVGRVSKRLLRFSEIAGSSEIANVENEDLLNNSLNNLSIEDEWVVKGSKKNSGIEPYPSTPKLLDDQERLLDELYGPQWRDSQGRPKPKSEKKKPTFQNLLPPKDKCKTEIKVKRSITHKNPYLDSEKKKSTLLQTLHSARLQINMESPWAQRLNKVCDSDTSSNKENQSDIEIRRRLDFENSDDDSDVKLGNINRKKLTPNEKGQNLKTDKVRKTVRRKKPSTPKPKHVVSSSTDTPKDSDSSDNEYYKSKNKNNVQTVCLKKSNNIHSFLESLSVSVPVNNCDPTARMYREDFKTRKQDLTKYLFDMYNKNIFENKVPDDTPLEWNYRMRGTAGYCYCRTTIRRTGAVERSVRIVLSTKVLISADRLRDTLVHEMCHAATWVINEVSDGHGPLWKAWASKAMKIYPELPPIKRCHDYVINTKYTYKCTSCGYSFGRQSKSLDLERKRCGCCFGKFEVFLNKNTKAGIKTVPVTPYKKPSAFANFVKENYKTVKSESLKHGDVMKILSKQFNEMKLNNHN